MSLDSLDSLVESRVAQLQEISKRRNVLLKEMYSMIRSRDNIGSVLALDEDGGEGEDLQLFLKKHDMNKNPDSGSIAALHNLSLFARADSQNTESAKKDASAVGTRGNSPKGARQASADSVDELDTNERPSRAPSDSRRSRSDPKSIKINGELEPTTVPVVSDVRPDSESSVSRPPQADGPGGDKGDSALKNVTIVASGPREDVIMQDVEQVTRVKVEERQAPSMHPAPQMSHSSATKKEEEEEEEESAMVVDTPQNAAPPVAPQPSVGSNANTTPGTLTPSANTPVTPAITVRPQDLHPQTPNISRPSSTQTMAPTPSKVTAGPSDSQNANPNGQRHPFDPHYTLPPIKSLPAEFNRKSKVKNKRREKEGKREKDKDKDKDRDEWTSLGLNRWGFTISANPVWRRVSRASKCLTTRDWSVAMTELRLTRVIDRIETLKDAGKWSFRQPKKQRAVDNINKTHWDYLLDEMKWMRIDFREERKWKIAVAYNLSTSVLEWHAAGSLEERLEQGICVKWRRPLEDDQPQEAEAPELDPGLMDVDDAEPLAQDSEKTSKNAPNPSMLMLDYGSDDDDGDDQDRESAVDALETAALIEESLDRLETEQDHNVGRLAPSFEPNEPNKEPKVEEVDFSSSLTQRDDMEVDVKPDNQLSEPSSSQDSLNKGLKSDSVNPVLASKSTTPGGPERALPTSKASRISMYGPVRERIVFSDADKLFVDLDDFKVRNPADSDREAEMSELNLPVADLADLFPDLQTLSLFDPPPVDPPPVVEGKKKDKKIDKDDGTKRVDEFTHSKVFPVGKFMTTKPTLVSALQPAKRWRNGQWLPWEEPPIQATEAPSTRALEEAASELFGRVGPRETAGSLGHLHTSKRDLLWTPKDDDLLKSLIEKYGALDREKGTNWKLIAECFNASRISVPSDRRNPGDCLLRWREKWGPLENHTRDLPPPSTPSMFGASVPSTPQPASMMTRGVKRLASNSVSSLTGPSLLSMGFEEPKNKRHKTVQDCMRKLIKRRAELAAKNSGRKSSNVHETHAQYAKLPFKTPSELVRVKMEKDKNELHAKQQAAQQAQAALANRKGVAVPAPANGQQQQPQQPPQPQQVPNGQTVPSQAPVPVQAQVATQVPAQPKPVASAQQPTSIPIRSQVNISQQRMATPHITNRPSPQQMLRNQQQMPQQGLPSHSQLTQQQIQSAIAHLQAQTAAAQAAAATQGANSLPVGNGTTASMSPPYARDSTSSPAHSSPSLTSAAATGNVNSPRPASTQPRATPGHYYLSNVGYTPEQLQMLSMRYQAQHQQQMQQAAQQAQQAQQGQQQQQQQTPQAPQQ